MALGDTVRAEMAQDPQFTQRIVVVGTKKAIVTIGMVFGGPPPAEQDGIKFAQQQQLAAAWIKAVGTYRYSMPQPQVPQIITRLAWAVASSFDTGTEHPDISDTDLTAEVDQVWPAIATATFAADLNP